MFKRILLPVAESPGPRAAVHSAIALVEAFHSELCIVSVVDPFPVTSVGTDLTLGRSCYLSEARQVAADAINKAHQMVKAKGLDAGTVLVEEHVAWKGILETAREVNADLVVIGSHGQHGLNGRVLGGVTHQVLLHTDIPVLVVHDMANPTPSPTKAWDVWHSMRIKGISLAQSQRRG